MGWKEKYIEKLNKRTVISEFNGQKVYLAKDKIFKEWRQIYPAVDEVTMKVNWTNLIFGGKKNLIKLLLVAGIVILVFLQFDTNFKLIEYYQRVCEPVLNLSKTVIVP